jgi:hypothetical protein
MSAILGSGQFSFPVAQMPAQQRKPADDVRKLLSNVSTKSQVSRGDHLSIKQLATVDGAFIQK